MFVLIIVIGQIVFDVKKFYVVVGVLCVVDGCLFNMFNDVVVKFQLVNVKMQEGVLKGKFVDMQKIYDDWYVNYLMLVCMCEVNGDEILMFMLWWLNLYQDWFDEVCNNLQQVDVIINKLQLLIEMLCQQVLFDQFDVSFVENLCNLQSQDDKDVYLKVFDGFFCVYQGELL